ncbi:MAG: hypothetical protein GXO27_04660 [Chlorobi bacterium]|nr:hypothetical protein [Chlorobiota bacterium]
MKTHLVAFTLIWVLFSCRSSKEIALPSDYRQTVTVAEESQGDAVIRKSVEIHTGKRIELKEDPTGQKYLVLEKGEGTVFVIRVQRNLKEPLPDSAMEYTLTFQTSNPVRKGEWENEALEQIRATVGFHAFHPDSGYKPLREGKIALEPRKKEGVIVIRVEIPGQAGKFLNGTYEVKVNSGD